MSEKVFDREAFESIKRVQKMGWDRDKIVQSVPWGKETVRKAMKAPIWAQYRKNEKQALRARQERRQAAANDLRLPGYTVGEGDLLIDKTEGELSPGWQARKQDKMRERIGWCVVLVVVLSLVLFLVVR